jgi:hypothetical protein
MLRPYTGHHDSPGEALAVRYDERYSQTWHVHAPAVAYGAVQAMPSSTTKDSVDTWRSRL